MPNNTVVLNIRVNANAANGVAGLQSIENGMQQTAAAARALGRHLDSLGEKAKIKVELPIINKRTGTVSASMDNTGVPETQEEAYRRLQAEQLKSSKLNEQYFNAFLNGANRTVNGLRQMAQGFQEVGFVLSTFVTVPLTMLLRSSVQSAMEFESQMAKVRKAVEMTDPKGYEKLEQRLRNLAKITPTPIDDLTLIAEAAGQLGLKDEAVYRYVNLVNKAVIGTGVAADTFATELGRVASALGMDLNTEQGIQDLEKLTSVMDIVAKKTSTDMDGIITAVQDAAVVGGMLKNLAPKDLVAGLGVLISSGVDPSAAGTNLQRWYVQVMKNSDKFAESMKGYSREVVDANGNIIESFEPYKDADEVMQRMNDEPIQVLIDSLRALETVAEEDKAQALKNMFEYAGLVGGRVGAMASNMDTFDDILKDVNQEWLHAIELQADYERMLNTTDSGIKIFKNNLKDVGITLGSYVLPTINEVAVVLIPAIQELGQAFADLPDSTKKLIIIIPVIGAVLGPLLFLIFSLIHAITLMGAGVVSIATGIGSWVFQLSRLIIKLGGGTKLIGPLVSKLGLVAKGTTAASGAAGVASRIFGGLIGTMLKWVGGIVGIPLAIMGVLKLFTKFGVDLSQYFTDLADRAKAWGERLMITYGNGMLAGAARAVSKVIQTVAGWIAKFFEAHSPPEEGPLSTIDQWGSAVMNTYLKGFLEADFSILSEVGRRIEKAFEIFASLNNLELGSLNETFMAFRENIAKVIDTFNKTGQVAEDVLSQIGTNLGTLGTDIQELIRLWLKYKQLQEKLAALEGKRKDTLKTYDSEIAKISKMNITAEEKAELIRQAQLNRDDELRQIEQEKKETEEQAEAAKDKLDWQKEYIDAQLEFLEMLKKDKEKKGSGDGGDGGIEPVDFEGMGADASGVLDPVKDIGEEINSWSTKIDRARSSWQLFKDAFMGKSTFQKLSPGDELLMQRQDPEAYKQYKQDESMHNLGTQLGDIYTKVEGPVTRILELLGLTKDKDKELNEELPKTKGWMEQIAASPLGQALQVIADAAANNVRFFGPLDRAFASLSKSLEKANENLNLSGTSWEQLGMVLGTVVGVIFAIITGLISIIINLVMVLVEIVVRIFGHVIENVMGFLSGVWSMLQGLWDIIVGLFTDNPERILTGLLKFGRGAYDIIYHAWKLVLQVTMDIVEGIVDLVIRLLTDLIAWILRLFGMDDVADKVQEWGDKAIEKVREWLDNWYDRLDEFKGKLHDWVNGVITWLNKIPGVEINANLNTSTSSSGNNYNGNPPPGLGSVYGPGAGLSASGGVTNPGKPFLTWVGEGKEQEAIIPLSKLPGVFETIYGHQQAASSGGIVLNINNPVVREEQDINKIADAVSRKLQKRTSNSSRLA